MTFPKPALVGLVALTVAALAPAQFLHTFTGTTNLALPSSGTGGAPGGASNAANVTSFTISVPIAVTVGNVYVGLDLSHASVGDLRMLVSHCGTTVVLYDQSPASTANLSGVYQFAGSAVLPFGTAINTAGPNGVVAPGTYLPASPLTAFDGMSSAGDWTFTIDDLVAGSSGALFGVSLSVWEVSVYGTISPVSLIPDGQGGNCLGPVTQIINVPSHGPVGDLVVNVNVTHTYVGDLDVSIQHAGVSVALSQWSSPSSGANVSGTYGFWDGAATAWADAETNFSATAIPVGTYRPRQPLSAFHGLDQAGPWYLTVCDRAAMDTGTLGLYSLEVARTPYHLTITQPNGPASVTLANTGGVPGHSVVNLFTLAQGNAPFGWAAGLDIPMPELFGQITHGPPFTGILGPCGSCSWTVPGPIPSNLTVWTVSIELDANGSPVAIDPVRTYTTP